MLGKLLPHSERLETGFSGRARFHWISKHFRQMPLIYKYKYMLKRHSSLNMLGICFMYKWKFTTAEMYRMTSEEYDILCLFKTCSTLSNNFQYLVWRTSGFHLIWGAVLTQWAYTRSCPNPKKMQSFFNPLLSFLPGSQVPSPYRYENIMEDSGIVGVAEGRELEEEWMQVNFCQFGITERLTCCIVGGDKIWVKVSPKDLFS